MSEQQHIKVLYVHGGNGNSQADLTQSPIALYLAKEFETLTPNMNTSNYSACLQQQKQAIKDFQPNVLVGHSLGGALICELLRNKEWQGPVVLLAPALVSGIDDFTLPKKIPIEICHGKEDTVVRLQISQDLVQRNPDSSITLTVYPEDPHSLPSTLLPLSDGGEDKEPLPRLTQLVQRAFNAMPEPLPSSLPSSSSSSSQQTKDKKKKDCRIS